MSQAQITEAELHAYVDSALSAARTAEIETYLAGVSMRRVEGITRRYGALE